MKPCIKHRLSSSSYPCRGSLVVTTDTSIVISSHRLCLQKPLTDLKMLHTVNCLLLSFEDYFCLPLIQVPSTAPWRITLEKFHIHQERFRRLTSEKKWFLMACTRIYLSRTWTSILYSPNARIRRSVSTVRVQLSHPFKRMDAKSGLHSLILTGKLNLLFHIELSLVITGETI